MTLAKEKKIISLVMNAFVNDSRVLKASTAAAEFGYESYVFALGDETGKLANHEKIGDVHVYRYYSPIERWIPTKTFRTLFRFSYCAFRTILKCWGMRPTYIHANDLTALPLGVVLKFLLRSKLLYDSHELWFDASRNERWPQWLCDAAVKFERSFIYYIDELITVSPGILEILQKNFDIDFGEVILNVPPKWEGVKSSKLRDALNLSEDQVIVLYQGGFDVHRGLQYVFPAIKKLPEHFVFVILGGSQNWDWAKGLAKENDVLDRVYFHEAVPYQELVSWTASANIGIYPTISSSLSYRYSLPNKFFEYIQGRIPVVVSDLPDICRFFERYDIGEVFREADVEDLVAKILKLHERIEKVDSNLQTELERAATDLSWDAQKRILKDIYAS